jgi:hypothetical protein
MFADAAPPTTSAKQMPILLAEPATGARVAEVHDDSQPQRSHDHADSDTLSAALAYAKAGWYVGPEERGTKNPARSSVRTGNAEPHVNPK